MHIIINGGGKIGEYLAHKMLAGGHRVAVIEQNKKKIDRLAMVLPQQALMILGDGCDSSFQADAGAEHADIFVATTGADDSNLVSCEIAMLVFNVPRAIARVNNPKNERIFRQLGIEAVSSTSVISRLIEIEATEGAVHAVMSLTQGDLVISEVALPRGMKAHSVEGKTVAEIKPLLPDESLLVAVGRGASLSIVNGSTVLMPGDVVMVVSKQGNEDQVRDALCKLW
ncbi:MAG: TrkA family potassium uptake protein [Coriobacteriales bacterium]|jgi:trk system potassium uptake protein TrkA|nr:TrkA family potassium uptake protein [Coriobacteriales bacterium]